MTSDRIDDSLVLVTIKRPEDLIDMIYHEKYSHKQFTNANKMQIKLIFILGFFKGINIYYSDHEHKNRTNSSNLKI